MAATDTIVPLDDEALWRSLYDDVLACSFPATELDPRDVLLERLRRGTLAARGVLDAGRVVAGVMTWRHARTTLVLYLAIAPEHRDRGLGGALLDDAVHTALEAGSDVVLVEIEHPGHHETDPDHGDPAARLRFYARHGVLLLAVPYVQPALGPGQERVPALLLGVLGLSDAGVAGRRGSGEPSAVRAAPVRAFLEHYLAACEGTLAQDGAVRRILEAVSGDEVAAVRPRDLEAVPVGTLEGDERFAPRG